MAIKDVIDEIGLSFDELCDASEIPSSTLSDILSGKAVLSHCQARTIQKLSKGLDMSMEEVLALEESDFPACDCVPDTADDDEYDESEEEGPLHRLGCPAAFRLFRCSMLEMLHILSMLKDGECLFVESAIEAGTVEKLYNHGCYDAALYTLGLIDYLCDKNDIPRLAMYDKYRGDTMEKTIYCPGAKEDPILDCVYFMEMIPQLLKFNMIETPETLKEY